MLKVGSNIIPDYDACVSNGYGIMMKTKLLLIGDVKVFLIIFPLRHKRYSVEVFPIPRLLSLIK